MVHHIAAAGFSDPSDYEAARPSYPREAVEWMCAALGVGAGSVVCDVAAGTGKFTRLLTGTGATVLALEPVPGMRATFRSIVPEVPLVAGTAEALPFADASLDAITVAQAWHWVDQERAAVEVRRVVRPGGGVGLVWNARDRSEPVVDAIWAIIDRVEKRAPWRNHEQWRDSAGEMDGFAPMQISQFRHAQELTSEQVTRRVASVSHVAVLPAPERNAVLEEVRAVVATHLDAAGGETVALPYRVDCFTFRRV